MLILGSHDKNTLVQRVKLGYESNHWHAIPVAARFKTYDHVNALYYIKGSILPVKTDQVDYTNIYDNDLNSEDFCN